MAGRPPLPVGAHGQIRLYARQSGWLATTKVRDRDGVTRRVSRVGGSKAGATRELKTALLGRTPPGAGSDLSGETPFRTAATTWLAEVARLRAPTTHDTYRRHLHHRVLPALGALRLHELTVPVVHRYLRDLEADLKPNTVRSCRSVVSGVLGFAAQQGAIGANPVRDAGRVEGKGKAARALTAVERAELLARLDEDERAVRDDLPDIVRFMLGSGLRIGETIGMRWWRVDLEAAEVIAGPVLVRWTGRGLTLNDDGKSDAALRAIPIPGFVTMMLRMRDRPDDLMAPVFPNTLGGWRDPNNTQGMFRRAMDGAGFDWVTTHVLRKTAITMMDQEKLSAREIAGHVGHARPSITMDTYMDLRAQGTSAAEALDAAMRPDPKS